MKSNQNYGVALNFVDDIMEFIMILNTKISIIYSLH